MVLAGATIRISPSWFDDFTTWHERKAPLFTWVSSTLPRHTIQPSGLYCGPCLLSSVLPKMLAVIRHFHDGLRLDLSQRDGGVCEISEIDIPVVEDSAFLNRKLRPLNPLFC